MTREEAIERLKQNKAAAEFYAGMAQNTNTIENELKDIEAMNMGIEALQADRLTEWIPVSERLPEENGKYIVSLEDSVYPEASFFNGKWFMRSFNGIAQEFGEYEVIAWMLMPEPYRGDGE